MAPPVSLKMRVQRSPQELVTPAKPTPNIFKQLSDIEDGESFRFQIPIVLFYKNNPSMKEKDPAKLIKEAIAKALVWYYPLAGRLREGPGKKLFVDCTGEGIIFIEAEADVTLNQFGDSLQPPFPCFKELLFDVPGSSAVLHCPLLLIQVTRLKCGGFIFALRLNHTMSDGIGLVQFLKAVSEIARGAHAPSILPVWQRHLLNARDTPRVTCTHHEFESIEDTKDTIIPRDDINMVHRSFFFASTDISTIRKLVPSHLQKYSTFELITTCLWRCRTIALQPDPDEQVRLISTVNVRNKFNPPLPIGYYGNGIVFLAAQTTARNLCQNPLAYALELVKKAKEEVTEEYVRSLADLMVIKGRPHFKLTRSYLVSDLSRIGLQEVDFGWGKPIYAGVAKGGLGDIPDIASFYVPVENHKGENGIVVPICLPEPVMEIFVKELDALLKRNHQCQQKSQVFIKSAI